jgi:hypothetical protein
MCARLNGPLYVGDGMYFIVSGEVQVMARKVGSR